MKRSRAILNINLSMLFIAMLFANKRKYYGEIGIGTFIQIVPKPIISVLNEKAFFRLAKQFYGNKIMPSNYKMPGYEKTFALI